MFVNISGVVSLSATQAETDFITFCLLKQLTWKSKQTSFGNIRYVSREHAN